MFAPGRLNAITDVAGVRVGQTTVVRGGHVRTGVTAILPHGGNLFTDRVPAALHVGNGFGKITGVTQLHELGELETPILLTCTLCVWKAADAMVDWMLEQPGMANVRSINPVVAETNDGTLNDIRSRPITPEHVRAALTSASNGPVAEGSVGAGTGTVAFGWKGGIGTSSRVLPQSLGGWTVGVLVQTNFGGMLQVLGAPVGKELGQYAFKRDARVAGRAWRRIVRDGDRDRRAALRSQPRASGGARDHGSGADGLVGVERIGRLRAGVLDEREGPPRRQRDAADDGGVGERADVRVCSRRPSRRRKRRSTTRCSRRRRRRGTGRRSRRFRSTRCATVLAKYGVARR